MKKTTVFAKLLACAMTAVFCAWGGVIACADGSENEPQATSYTVTFDTDGGSAVASQTVEAGKTVAEPVAPTKDGYTFVGWYNGETAFSFTTTITTDITLKAHWVAQGAEVYTVTFDTDGGSAVASRTVEAGKLVAEPVTPTKEGYIFVGWYNGETVFSFTTPIIANITLTAKWVTSDAEVYTVTFDTDGGSAVASQTVEAGKTVAEPVPPTKEGHTFLGWYNGETEFSFTTTIPADITLKAKWEAVAGSGGDDDKTPGTDPSKPAKPLEKPSEPTVSEPVAGKPTITKASAGELETAYVEWQSNNDNAKWYNVYVKSVDAGEWTKLDGPLVREYADYFRADALGLKAGTYDMKVVPVSGEDTEATEYASEATGITVYAHERAGYAFTGGNVPGAYNMDGTLKAGAQVIYVTAETAKTVTATVNGATVTGFQAILDARQKGGEQPPLCIRIVGTIKASDLDKMSSSSEGLQIKGKSESQPAENITIEGVGSDGTIKDFGMLLRACKNDEIRNLGILNCMDDGVSIDTDNSHLWVHNLDIFYGKKGSGDKVKGDGALDTKNSTLITHSYNHFWDCGKCNLQGMKSEAPNTRITYHHNWYDHSDSRHPRIRTATVHIYNNYYDGNAKYGVGVTMGASAFVEKNYFRSTAAMRPMMSSGQGTDATGEKGTFSGENGGMIKSFGNKYDCTPSNLKLMTQNNTSADNIDCYEAASREEKVPATYKTKSGGTTYNNFDTATDMYEYEVDTPEQAKEKVVRYAGRVGGGDLKWEFNNATEDKNYDIIPGLSSAILDYNSSVVKIGGGTASTTPGGSTGGGEGEGGGDNKEEEKPVTPAPEGVVGSLTFTGSSSTPNPVSAGIIFTVTSSGIDFYPSTGKVRVFKGDSNSTITFTTPGSTEKEYMCTLACFDKGSAATVSIIGGNETITGSIPAGTGKQGSKTDLSGTTGNVTVKLKGNTAYTIKQGSKEFGIVSVTITE